MSKRSKSFLLFQVVSLGLFGSRKAPEATEASRAEARRRAALTATATDESKPAAGKAQRPPVSPSSRRSPTRR